MVLIGWALLGMALGAAGTEVLRTSRPELVAKVENAARRLVDSFCSSRPADEKTDNDTESAGDADAS